MNSNLHPIFQQAIQPFAPRSHDEINDAVDAELFNNEAFLAGIDKAVSAAKALPFDQTPAYHRALDAQVQAQNRGSKA